MPQIIKRGEILDDSWQLVSVDAETLPTGNILVPLPYWLGHLQELNQRKTPIGVWLDPHEEVEQLANHLDDLPVIAVNFPRFVDGRGFSTARILRDRYNYKGEIRAIGYFIRDQLYYLSRCGFDAFQLQPEADLLAARESLKDFSNAYQGAVDQTDPLFRRR